MSRELTGEILNGQVTVGTTRVQLMTGKGQTSRGIVVKALASNSGKVYVGTVAVTATGSTGGFELSARDSVTVYADDPNTIYVIADDASQGVCYIGATLT